jgi:hypothetical protein
LVAPEASRIRFDRYDPSVLLQPPGHLLRGDVYRINAPSAVLQEAIREASR